MYKLGLEKAEEPEIKLWIFVGSWKKQGRTGKTSASASLSFPAAHRILKARVLKWFALPTSGILAEYAEMGQTVGAPELARFGQPGLGVPHLDTWVFQASSSDISLWPWWSRESQDRRMTVSQHSQQQGHFPTTHGPLESPVLPDGSAGVNSYNSSLVALLWPAG